MPQPQRVHCPSQSPFSTIKALDQGNVSVFCIQPAYAQRGPSSTRTTTYLRSPSTNTLATNPGPTTQTPVAKMCIVTRKVYPSCGHLASGTVMETYYCENAGPNFQRCQPGAGLEYQTEYYSRGYCDACIMRGIEVAKAKCLDMDVYARSIGVRLSDLLSAYPSWRP